MSDLIHEVLSEGFRHDFGRADAAFVVEDDINGLLRVVGNGEQVQIAGADEGALVLHLLLHPTDQSFPVLTAKKNDWKCRDAAGLHQGQNFIEFVESAEASGHENESD